MIAFLLLGLAAATPSDSTASPPQPVLTLPEVRVEARRPEPSARRRQPTGFVSDVPAGASGHAFETLGDLLGRTAGARIQQYGGLGSFATVSLRGAPAGQLAVYVDGSGSARPRAAWSIWPSCR